MTTLNDEQLIELFKDLDGWMASLKKDEGK